MHVDTEAVHALACACSDRAADLTTAAGGLAALPGPGVAAAFGRVGAGFLAALADAVAAGAREITTLSADFAAASTSAHGSATAYAETEQHAASLL